jgi:hypothetical protein
MVKNLHGMQEVRGFDSHRLHPVTSTYAVGLTSMTRCGCLTRCLTRTGARRRETPSHPRERRSTASPDGGSAARPPRRGVCEDVGDSLERHARGREQRGGLVAQLVRRPVAQTGALGDLVEGGTKIARIQWRANGGSGDMAAVVPPARRPFKRSSRWRLVLIRGSSVTGS